MNKLKYLLLFLAILSITGVSYYYFTKNKQNSVSYPQTAETSPSLTVIATEPVIEATKPIQDIKLTTPSTLPVPQATEPPKKVEKSSQQLFRELCGVLSNAEKITLKDNLGHKNTGLNFPKKTRYQVIDLSENSIEEVKVSVEGIDPPKGFKVQYAFCEGEQFCQGDSFYQYRVGSRWQNSNTYTLKVKPGYRTVGVDFKILGINPNWPECGDYTDNEAKPNGFFRFQFINSSNEPAQ